MKDKNILFICNRTFWPPRGGHEMELYHYCRGLSEVYGCNLDVYIFDNDDKKDALDEKPVFINNVYFSKRICLFMKVSNILYYSFLSRKKWPLQCSLYYSYKNSKYIKTIVDTDKYDMVIVDMIRLAPYFDSLKESSCKKVLDIDDLLSKRYIRQLDSLTDKTTIEGQYQAKLPSIITRVLKLNVVKKIVLKLEISRMRDAELYYGSLYDKVIFVSPIETEEYNKKLQTNKAITISLGVDYDYYSESIGVSGEDGVVVFVGNMFTPANADSVKMIIEEILPKCKFVSKFVCIGNCPNWLKNEYTTNNVVEFVGPVNDLREFVLKGKVFLSPLAYGTGIKTKILEAMAMGLPVVTNSVGSEGIAAINGKHWYVSDDSCSLAKYVDELMVNQDIASKMGGEGQKFVKNYYQWNVIFKEFEKLGIKNR